MRKASVLNFDIQTREILREWMYTIGISDEIMQSAEKERINEKILMMPDKKTYQNKKKLVVKNS